MNTPHVPKFTGERCPSVETLNAFAHGKLTANDSESIATHIHRCSRCLELLQNLPDTSLNLVGAVAQQQAGEGDLISTVEAGPGPRSGFPTSSHTHSETPVPILAPLLGRYHVRRQIGKGGFGTVYLAHDEELARLVAVKVLTPNCLPSAEEQFAWYSEARLHAALDHPNIVPIYDVGRSKEIPFFLISKWIDGENLAERIKRDRPRHDETVKLLVLIANALAHMHGRGLVHRDIKPRNILLDKAGVPYLADFGLAIRPIPPVDDSDSGRVVGTPAYMSPEQAQGQGDHADGRSDIYSLGVVMYEMLTGVKPFRGEASSLRRQILHVEPRAPRSRDSHIPRDLEAICQKAMVKDPAGRYQQVEQFAEDLQCYLQGKPLIHARHVGWVERSMVWLARNATLTMLAGIALVAVIVAVVFTLRGTGTAAPPAAPSELSLAVTLQTKPEGANLSYYPLDGKTGLPGIERVVRARASEQVTLRPGYYMVVAVLPAAKGEAERFHEVFRLVPGDQQAQSGLFPHNGWRLINEVIHLPRIDIPPADVTKNMALFPASERFLLGLGGQMLDKEGKLVPAPTRTALVPAFFLDPTEVSVLCYRHWAEGEQENAIGPQGKDDFPATSVRWDQAVACAEKAGKRLPDEVEHEYAATVCGTRRFPWGEFLDPRGVKKWSFGPVHQRGSDVVELPGQPPVLGLYSNVAEWTSSWPGSLPGAELSQMRPMLRVVRGGPMSVVNGSRELREPVQGPTERLTFVVPIGHKGLGFRGARSARPRLTANDFVTIRDR